MGGGPSQKPWTWEARGLDGRQTLGAHSGCQSPLCSRGPGARCGLPGRGSARAQRLCCGGDVWLAEGQELLLQLG